VLRCVTLNSQPSSSHLLDSPSDVENYPATEVYDFASGRGICQQISRVRHGNESRAIKNRDTPQPEGLATSLQIGAARRLRSAELNPEIRNFARKNRIGYNCNEAYISSGTRIAVEVLSRPGLSERELFLGEIARRDRKIARVDARCGGDATREHRREPEKDYEFHTHTYAGARILVTGNAPREAGASAVRKSRTAVICVRMSLTE
jgi:hypothetical protein